MHLWSRHFSRKELKQSCDQHDFIPSNVLVNERPPQMKNAGKQFKFIGVRSDRVLIPGEFLYLVKKKSFVHPRQARLFASRGGSGGFSAALRGTRAPARCLLLAMRVLLPWRAAP